MVKDPTGKPFGMFGYIVVVYISCINILSSSRWDRVTVEYMELHDEVIFVNRLLIWVCMDSDYILFCFVYNQSTLTNNHQLSRN